jgi:peptide/nickel transport system substrate-binding protein
MAATPKDPRSASRERDAQSVNPSTQLHRRWPLAAATAVLLFAQACSGASTPVDESGSADEPDDQQQDADQTGTEVRNPGVFVHALGGEPETLDPAAATDGGYGNRAIVQVYEFLIDIPSDGPEPVPMLATEVPTEENGLVSADGLTYTFPIREGVTFHDGSELTADDVKYSWDRAITMDLPEGQASRLTDVVVETRVVDDYTFEVEISEPAAWFLTTVVYSSPAAVVSQEAVEANGGVAAGETNQFMTTSMVGTGPYRFVSWDRGERLTFEKNEDYWGDVPALDARWEVSPDNSVAVLGMQAGDYDLVEPIPQFVAELQNNENVCVDDSGFVLEPLHLAFNLDIDPTLLPDSDTIPPDFFHDIRVRKAFVLAFDYDAMINAGLEGFGALATYLPPGILGWAEDAPRYEQDLAEAEQLFRDSGWWDEGFEVSVLVESNNPTFTPVGLILKDSLEAMNPEFRVNVVQVAETQFDEAHAQTPFAYPMWIKNADPFTDPHQYMSTYFHPDGEWGSRLGYRNGVANADELAAVIDEGASSTDVDERQALYEEALQLIYDDPTWLWAADERNVQIFQCWVEGFTYNPLWVMPRWAFYDKG